MTCCGTEWPRAWSQILEARGPFESRSFRHIIRSCLSRGTSVWPSLSSPAIKQLHSLLQSIKPDNVMKRKGLTSYVLGPRERGALVLILRTKLLIMKLQISEDWSDWHIVTSKFIKCFGCMPGPVLYKFFVRLPLRQDSHHVTAY